MKSTRAGIAAALAVVVLGGGVLALDGAGLLPSPTSGSGTSGTAYDAGPAGHDEASSVHDSPGEQTSPTTHPRPLERLDASAPAPTTEGLTAALTPGLTNPALGSSVGIEVRDGMTGGLLFGREGHVPRTPASTTKLLTAAAVAHVGDLDAPFTTRVVRGDGNDVVLVAGGDTLLASGAGDPGAVAGRAGLADLAAQTAAALTEAGTTTVRVVLDDSFARGPAVADEWGTDNLAAGYTGPVAMLGTTDTRAWPGDPSPEDPALFTTSVFATALVDAGISVAGRPDRVAAPAEATELAAVDSAPLGEVLAEALDQSDNALTESLARSTVARAGLPVAPTFADTSAWVEQELATLGVDVHAVSLADCSGLSRSTRVPVSAVADVLTLASTGSQPGLADVLARLPVAGLSGTLHDRFHTADSRTAAGHARAKTGTLTGVHGLGGTVVDADGRLLVYAVLADEAGGTLEARAALDALIATLGSCGCR